jgi:hypothetical protein
VTRSIVLLAILQAASAGAAGEAGSGAGAAVLPPGSVMFDAAVPRDLMVLRIVADPPRLAAIRYRRIEVPIWGYRVAVLFDNGPRCRGQWQRGIGEGGTSIVNVEFLRRERALELLPVVARPLEDVLPDRGPLTLLPPRDPGVEVLRANLLRACWRGRPEASDPDRFARACAVEDQVNGLLHEVAHSFGAWGRPLRALPSWENEERSHLTALRHGRAPQQAWHGILGQYRSGEGIYFEAVQDILALHVAWIWFHAGEYPAIDAGKNIMAQLHKLTAPELNALAGHAMRRRFGEWDRARGLALDHDGARRLEEVPPEVLAPAPEEALPGDAAPDRPARRVRMSIASATLECDGLRAFPTLASTQSTWGKTHWRIAGDAVVGGVFRAPPEVKRAVLRVVHMATRDGNGRGGRTFIAIALNDGLAVKGHGPPDEGDNPLARPEEFDVTARIRPGAANAIAFGMDPARRSDLVYWLEGFVLEME